LFEDLADRIAGGEGDVEGGGRPVDAVIHGRERGDAGALAFGDGEHRAVVLGAGHLEAGVDAVLDGFQVGIGKVQVLKRDHRAVVGVDAQHRISSVSLTPNAGAGRVRAYKARASPVWLTETTKNPVAAGDRGLTGGDPGYGKLGSKVSGRQV